MYDNTSTDDLGEESAYKLKIFKVGSLSVGLFEDQITAIAEWNEPTPLPFAPASVLGVVCIQGRMFTALDLAQLVNPDEANVGTRNDSRQLIVALRGDEQLALAVAGTSEETLEVIAADIKAPKEQTLRLFLGTVEQPGEQVQVLDVKELFPAVIHGRERRRRHS
jgi:chemotaxis signal transduction protein